MKQCNRSQTRTAERDTFLFKRADTLIGCNDFHIRCAYIPAGRAHFPAGRGYFPAGRGYFPVGRSDFFLWTRRRKVTPCTKTIFDKRWPATVKSFRLGRPLSFYPIFFTGLFTPDALLKISGRNMI